MRRTQAEGGAGFRFVGIAIVVLASLGMLALLAACGQAAPKAPTPTSLQVAGEEPTPTPLQVGLPVPAPQSSDIAAAGPTPTAAPLGEKPEYGGTMRYGSSSGTAVLDPYELGGTSPRYGFLYLNSLVQQKFPYDPSKGNEYEGSLATEWLLSADGTKWTFKLRQGVTWHDGEAFNADDVVATFQRLLDPKIFVQTRSVGMRDVYAGIQKVDDYTVILDMGTPNSTAFSWFSSIRNVIAPAHLIKGNPNSPDPNVRWKFIGPDPVKRTGTLLVGTGPFVMKKWNDEVEVIGERNPNYWKKDKDGNPLPYLDRIEHLTIPDPTRLLANFVGGKLNYSGGLSVGMHPDKAKQLCQSTRDQRCYTVHGPHGNFGTVLNHVGTPAFQDKRIVAATRYSMDMEEIFRKAYGGRLGFTWMDRDRFPDTALTIKEQYELLPWSDPSRRPELVQKAKDLLTEAGYPNGLDLNFPFFGSCSGAFLEHSSYMADDMHKVGIRNFLECRQGIVGRDEVRAGRFSVAMNVVDQFKVDPGHKISVTALLDSPAVGQAPWRWGANQIEVDRLFRDTVRTVDVSVRNEKYRNMERFMADPSFTVFPNGYSRVFYSVHGCVHGFNPGGTWDSSNYTWERAWLEKECR